jgi:predicted hydrolase (HD superfamily)
VKKKWKDKAFARGVDRDVIAKGAELLGVSLDSLIEETIVALRPVAKEIGLEG